ncbi:MAG: glutaredoxin family protein [bacterium]|nr:glutaredoxin family protein [bacterium]
MPTVTLYTRQGCHLCDDAHEVLREARREAEFEIEVLDIDCDPELKRLYDWEVPVVAIDGVKAFKYRMSREEFLKRLKART